MPGFITALILLLLTAPCTSFVSQGVPIWHSNSTSSFALFRSPTFTLRSPSIQSATLYFTALGSPGTQGTLQPKLLGAACPYLNGVLLTCGPGHNTNGTGSQVVRGVNLLPYLRPTSPNTLGVASFYNTAGGRKGSPPPNPRVQAWVEVEDGQGVYTLIPTGVAPGWQSLNADPVYVPTGEAGISWYHFPNEFLDRQVYPLGWATPEFTPTSSPLPWTPPAPVDAFPAPLYLSQAPTPVLLQRTACGVTHPPATPGRTIIDYGQEFMGGVNLTFLGGQAGDRVRVIVGEVLAPGGGAVLCPMTTGNKWNSTWTLSGDPAKDAHIVHHEFIQFRYAQVDILGGASSAAAATTTTLALPPLAWVLQYPMGGDGMNPWEAPCSTSQPAATLWGAPAQAPTRTPLASFSSTHPDLDRVWAFCAYTIGATTQDVNVDGQTRERDVDIVDSLNNERGQYSTFSPGAGAAWVAERTLREFFTNDTGIWSQWYDFKASAVMAARDHALFTGDLGPIRDFWAPSDRDITSPGGVYNSLQVYSGLAYYFNTSGSGLLVFPPNGSCGGSWACNILLDWPTTTRDGYDASAANSEDTARSALGAMAIGAMGDAGGWVGKGGDGARYDTAAATIAASLATHNLRVVNSSHAFFVDGRVGPGPAPTHAAVHSTLLAVSAGAVAAGGLNASVCRGLVAYLVGHGVAPSSCMMGRWWVEALYRLGVEVGEGADAALAVLTAKSYPGWLDMLAQGATTTMEAWRPQDKGNLDWAHPWCATPSFTIPGLLLGAMPVAPGWSVWRLAPQPSDIAHISAQVPTPGGMVPITWDGTGVTNATVTVGVMEGQRVEVCLPLPGTALQQQQQQQQQTSDTLYVDGSPVEGVPYGRLLCTPSFLAPGPHTVARIAQ